MDTVRVLDHYRATVADDRIGMLILALLAREGAQTEDEMFNAIRRFTTRG